MQYDLFNKVAVITGGTSGIGLSIINLASDAEINGNLLCTAYCASKGAVIALTKSISFRMRPL